MVRVRGTEVRIIQRQRNRRNAGEVERVARLRRSVGEWLRQRIPSGTRERIVDGGLENVRLYRIRSRCEELQCGLGDDDVIIESVAPTQTQLPVTQHIPSESKARGEVIVIVRIS